MLHRPAPQGIQVCTSSHAILISPFGHVRQAGTRRCADIATSRGWRGVPEPPIRCMPEISGHKAGYPTTVTLYTGGACFFRPRPATRTVRTERRKWYNENVLEGTPSDLSQATNPPRRGWQRPNAAGKGPKKKKYSPRRGTRPRRKTRKGGIWHCVTALLQNEPGLFPFWQRKLTPPTPLPASRRLRRTSRGDPPSKNAKAVSDARPPDASPSWGGDGNVSVYEEITYMRRLEQFTFIHSDSRYT